MATFTWNQKIEGGCVFCGTPAVDRGFVDCIADTVIRALGSEEIVGVVDIKICADCLQQASRLVGCGSPQDFDELVRRCDDAEVALEKTKDEVQSWTQRFNNLVEALGRGEEIASIAISDTRIT